MIQYRKYLSSPSHPFYLGALVFKWEKEKDGISLFSLGAFKYKELIVYLLVCLFFKFPITGSSSMTDAVSAQCPTTPLDMLTEELVCTID